MSVPRQDLGRKTLKISLSEALSSREGIVVTGICSKEGQVKKTKNTKHNKHIQKKKKKSNI